MATISDLPSNFISRMNVVQDYVKAPIRILPVTGSGTVRENGYIKLVIPAGVCVDLSTLNITFWGRTLLNNATVPANKLVGFPKWTNSLIQDLDIWIGNRCVQKFPYYGWVHSLYADYKSNFAAKCKEVGINADPSVYTYLTDAGAITKWNTYTPSTSQAVNSFQNFYCWNDFMGFLNSVKIIDTNLTGQIELHIRLAPSTVLWGSALAGETLGYELQNIVAYVDKLDWKNDRYQTYMNSMLSNGGTLKIPYKNYGVYLGDALTNSKTCTVKLTESTECLDKIILSFMDNTQPNGGQPLQLGDANTVPATAAYAVAGSSPIANIGATVDTANVNTVIGNINTALVAIRDHVNNNFVAGRTPASLFNFTNLLSNNDDKLLNTSLYFKRNGLGCGGDQSAATVGQVGTSSTVQFQINSQDITHPLTILEQHNSTMCAFELNDDPLAQCNPAIKNLPLYERDFYACAFSTSHINDKLNGIDYTLVSGLDTMSTAMNISVKVVDARGASANKASIPVVITEMTSHLQVGAGRNILPVR